jgi:hypothetical protein
MKTPLPNIDMMHCYLGDAANDYLVASHKKETATRELWAGWGFERLTHAVAILGYKLVLIEQSEIESAKASAAQAVRDAEIEVWKSSEVPK